MDRSMGNLSMTKHKVVLVPFPFDDFSSDKVRPAVCLTDPIGSHDHLILAFITSRVPATPLDSVWSLSQATPISPQQVCGFHLRSSCIA
jgi:mRNA interferase MazF